MNDLIISKKLRLILITVSSIVLANGWSYAADGVPGTVTTDPFDLTQGTVITSHDTLAGPEGVFGAISTFTESPGGHTLMRNGGTGSVSYIEFKTPKQVPIRGVRLFAASDGAGFSYRRAMNNFKLLADRDGDGSYEYTVVNTAINIDYSRQAGNVATNPSQLDLTLLSSETVGAMYWRLEVTQGTNVQPFEGARIVELDAIPADSCDTVPGTSTSDLFDATRGTVITGHDTLDSPENIFDTCKGFENGHTIMRNGGLNSISYVNFKTSKRVSVKGIRVFAHNDGAEIGFRRAMNNFKLFGDLDGDGTPETVLIDTAINPDYSAQTNNAATDPTNLDLTLNLEKMATSQNWRIEVGQGSSVGDFEGVRIVEVDAIAADHPICDIVPGVSNTDAFDILKGTKVIASDAIIAPENAFTSCTGFEDGHTLMRNAGTNSISHIEFETPDVVYLKGVRLFAHNDGDINFFRRAMSHFKLLADRDGDGRYEFTFVDADINIDYKKQNGNIAVDPTNLNLELDAGGVVGAKYWRLEVTQGTDVQPFEGARLVELDAIEGDPNDKPATNLANIGTNTPNVSGNTTNTSDADKNNNQDSTTDESKKKLLGSFELWSFVILALLVGPLARRRTQIT